jgi:pyruvate/2-oxoglutarate dehydrogenase complex dihydrolipoamide acyltransferase (E2) component
MPFWYHLPLPDLPNSDSGPVRLVEWLVDDGARVKVGTRVLAVQTPTDKFLVLANGEGVLSEKLFPVGSELPPGTPVAVVRADGEAIPYGGPYSVAERLDLEN